jgi:hypothetical protein
MQELTQSGGGLRDSNWDLNSYQGAMTPIFVACCTRLVLLFAPLANPLHCALVTA